MFSLEVLDRRDHVFGPAVDLDRTGTPVIEAGPGAIRRVTGGGQRVIRGNDLEIAVRSGGHDWNGSSVSFWL